MTGIEDVLLWAVAQSGDRYIMGAEADFADPNPDVFDCSELVQWSCHRAGVEPPVPDGSWVQARHCRSQGTLIADIRSAVATRGALLFSFSSDPFAGGRPDKAHVAWSLGDGTTIEAKGRKWGVGSWTADPNKRRWTHAALIPGVSYSPRPQTRPDVTYLEEDDMFTFGAQNKPIFFVSGGHAVGLNEEEDLVAIRKGVKPAPLPHFQLDDDTYAKFVSVFRDGKPG